jgi:hypothetical protein
LYGKGNLGFFYLNLHGLLLAFYLVLQLLFFQLGNFQVQFGLLNAFAGTAAGFKKRLAFSTASARLLMRSCLISLFERISKKLLLRSSLSLLISLRLLCS